MRSRERKPPPPISPAYLERVGGWYLERYGGTSKALRRCLQRRVERSAQHHPIDRQQARRWIEDTVDRFQKAGLVDDAAWARSRARSMLARGLPVRAIRQRLRAKGIGAADAEAALADLAEQHAERLDLLAALAYLRRRGFGPYRQPDKRGERRQRDLAAMGRAGFRYDLARRLIDAPDVASLQQLIEEA